MPERTLQYGIQIVARRVNEQAFAQTQHDLHGIESAAADATEALAGMQGGLQGFASFAGSMAGAVKGDITAIAQLADASLRAQFEGLARARGGQAKILAAPFEVLPKLARTAGGNAIREFFAGAKESIGGAQDMLGGGILKSLPVIGPMYQHMQQTLLAPITAAGNALGWLADLFGNVVGGIVRGAQTIGRAVWQFVVQAFEASLSAVRKFAEIGLKGLLIGIIAIGAVVGAGTKAFTEYEQDIRNAGTVTGLFGEELNAAEKQLADFGRTVARESSFMPTDVAGAFYALASAGLDVQQTMQATRGVVALAEATMSDMEQSAELVTQALNSFRLSADQATRVANVFAAAIGKSPLNMERLAASFPYAAAQASAFGLSIEETTAALMALSKAGLTGSMAGTGLRGVLAEMTVQSDRGKEILASYGLTMRDIDPTVNGFAQSIENVRRAGMSASDMMEVFGRRSGPAMVILTREGKAGLDALQASITGTDSALRMQAEQLHTTVGAYRLLRSTVQEALMGIGEGMGKMAAGGMRILNQTLLGMADKGQFQAIGQGVGAFVGALFGGMDQIGPQLSALGERVAKFFSADNMSKFGAQVRSVANEVWAAAKALWNLAVEVLPKVAEWGAEALGNLWSWLKEKLPEDIGVAMGFVRDLGLGFIDFGETAEETLRGLAGPLAKVLEFFALLLDGVLQVGKGLDWLLQKTAAAAEALHIPGAGALRAAASASSGVRKAMGLGKEALQGAAEGLYEYAGYKRHESPTGPRWVRDTANADAWRDAWSTRRQNWMLGTTDAEIQSQMAVQRGFAWGERMAADFRAAGQVAAPPIGTAFPGTDEVAYARQRGAGWGAMLLNVAEQAMTYKLQAWEGQKQRNTLRPSWQ